MPLVSLTSVPLQVRDYFVSDWVSMALWCDDSEPKRPGPQLMRITIHLQPIIFVMLWCASQLTHMWLQAKKNCSVICGGET